MAEEDNQTLQAEEIEALSSIYGDDWIVVDEKERQFCIRITDDKFEWTIVLEVHFPADYPKSSPPQYQLSVSVSKMNSDALNVVVIKGPCEYSAPWLRGDEKQSLESALADIYCENIGESVIYMWVEKIRDLVQTKSQTDTHCSEDKDAIVKYDEEDDDEDDDDYDFDLSSLELELASSSSSEQPDDGETWESPTVSHGEPFTDRKSVFQAHISQIFHKKQVKMVLDMLYSNKKIANATHNIYAYRIWQSEPFSVFYQGCEDDGETQAGSRLLHLLQIVDAKNVMVVVTRWYGGVHLGPDRFKHINNCARQLLEANGYIKGKEDIKGPKSRKKKK